MYYISTSSSSFLLIRLLSYHSALAHQPVSPLLLNNPLTVPAAYLLLAFGNVLVLSSMWALGITGTYLGDYFGILMDEMVTGFPFNVTDAPMYWGSSCSFLGTALLYAKPSV
jgi:phosphatidylethanolamine N-methyltransferase